MGNCQVCNTTLGSSSRCRNCGWPTGAIEAITNPALQREALLWVRGKYKETLNATGTGLSPSTMNAQIGGLEGLDSLKSDLVALSRKLQSTEEQQLKSGTETGKLAHKSQELEQSIQKINKSISDMSSFLHHQNNKNQELTTEQQRQSGEINWLKSILKNPTVNLTGNQPISANLMVPMNAPVAISNAPDLGLVSAESDLLREYNGNSQEVPGSLRDRSINVSIDDETFNRLRNGDESNIAFKPDRKGNYLVITRAGFRYLVPNKQRRIITQIYTVTKAIYKCDGYSESYKDFRLIKPALVTEELIDCWKLSQQGILEFI
jgi:hypothetical protein